MPLLSLPIELRLQIFEYLLIANKPIHSWCPGDNALQSVLQVQSHDHPQQTHLDLSIFLVCRQIHKESITVFFNRNEFIWHGGSASPSLLTGYGYHRRHKCPLTLPSVNTASYLTSVGIAPNTLTHASLKDALDLLEHLSKHAPKLRSLKLLDYGFDFRLDRMGYMGVFRPTAFLFRIADIITNMHALREIRVHRGLLMEGLKGLDGAMVGVLRRARPDIFVLTMLGPR
jgi:hypothetical protein